MKKNLPIFLSILAAALLIGGSLIYSLGKKSLSDSQNNSVSDSQKEKVLDISSAPILGDVNAPVTLVEFADFQCPACNFFFQQIEPQIREKYVKTGKVKIAFKTLTFIDSYDGYREPKESFLAGVAGECAKEQGNFWSMHDAIFEAEKEEMVSGKNSENSGNLNKPFFLETAKKTGLDISAFTLCLDNSKKFESYFEKNMKEAEKLMPKGVATPTVFINGEMIQGVAKLSQYEEVIEKFLNSNN